MSLGKHILLRKASLLHQNDKIGVHIGVLDRKIGMSGRSFSVKIPQTFAEFEEIEKGQKWFFLFSLGGSIRVFTKNPRLTELRKELEKILELIDYHDPDLKKLLSI